MYRNHTRNFRVGALVLTAGTLFVAMLAFVIGGSLHSEKVHFFILYEENVKGMVVGSRVNFQGVPVGSVEDIRFQNGNTLVDFAMDPSKARIQDVTRARLDRAIVTGQVTIELEGYEPDGKPLQPGAFIQPAADPMTSLMQDGVPEILGNINDLLTESTELVRRVEQIVSPENLERITTILDHVEGALDRLPPRIDELLVAVDERTRGVDGVIRQAEELLARLSHTVGSDDVTHTLASVRETADGLAALRAEAEGLLADLRGTVASVRHPLRSMLTEGRAAVVAVRRLARRLSDAPSAILYGVDQGEIDVPANPPR